MTDRSQRPATAARIAAIDRAAIDRIGIPRLLLMDHAGLAVADEALRLATHRDRARRLKPHHSIRETLRFFICAGTGFNGGDGLSAGRHLAGLGHRVHCFLIGARNALRQEPAIFASILDYLHVRIMERPDGFRARDRAVLRQCDAAIDALLGVGLRGPVRPGAANAIEALNDSRVPIVSADVPSGLDADTGQPHGVAIRARVTVTFGLPKLGFFRKGAAKYVGRLVVNTITIPKSLLTP